MTKYLFALVVVCQLFGFGSSNNFCEDRSTSFEHGRLECVRYSNYHSNRKYTCTVKCDPGYIEKPAKNIYCNSNGNRVWKVDSQGNQAQVYYGTWTANISQVQCEAPTSCHNVSPEDAPQHGQVVCTTNNTRMTCVRTCSYPYEVTEPAFQEEHCGPDTNFFWSHVLRSNVTKMPPCAAPTTCRPLRKSDIPDHGQMVCRREEWADSTICELNCERGYIPKSTSKPFEFCGPTTAFIWSHIHGARNPSARIGGCEQAPLTAEIILTVNRTCEAIDSKELQQGAYKMLGILNSTIGNLTVHNVKLNVSIISWRTHCKNNVMHEKVEVDDVVYALWADYTDKEAVDNLVLKEGTASESSDDNLMLQTDDTTVTLLPDSVQPPIGNLEGGNELKDSTPVAVNHSPQPTEVTTTCTQEPATTTSGIDATNETESERHDTGRLASTTRPTPSTDNSRKIITINTVVTELIFSYHIKLTCKYGRCREACAVLGISKDDNRCVELCKRKAKPTTDQVRHLTTSYTDRIIEAVDVSNASTALFGANFKLLNVTENDYDDYNPTDSDMSQIGADNQCQYLSSCSVYDQC